MNTYISEIVRARAIRLGVNMFYCCMKLKLVLKFGHASYGLHKSKKVNFSGIF